MNRSPQCGVNFVPGIFFSLKTATLDIAFILNKRIAQTRASGSTKKGGHWGSPCALLALHTMRLLLLAALFSCSCVRGGCEPRLWTSGLSWARRDTSRCSRMRSLRRTRCTEGINLSWPPSLSLTKLMRFRWRCLCVRISFPVRWDF